MNKGLFHANDTLVELVNEQEECEPNNFLRIEKSENEVGVTMVDFYLLRNL